MELKKIRENVLKSAEKAVTQLIKVANEKIDLSNDDEENGKVAAEKLKTIASSKKLAIFDALDILDRVESERKALSDTSVKDDNSISSFAESRAK